MVSAFDFSDFASPLKDLPDVNTEEYTDEELGRELFRAGVSNRNVEDILVALRQAERLIGWYQDDRLRCPRHGASFVTFKDTGRVATARWRCGACGGAELGNLLGNPLA
jgi:ribosomal protein S27AE